MKNKTKAQIQLKEIHLKNKKQLPNMIITSKVRKLTCKEFLKSVK